MRPLYLLAVVCLLLVSSQAHAFELGFGLSAIEEGDDRIRPGIILHGSFLDNYTSRATYYGRKFGPVTERTLIISGFRHLDLYRFFNNNFLYGGLGLALMNEQTVIDIPGDSETENNLNLGFNFGLHADIPVPGPMFIRASMESHMFLAGIAGVLLANGRKNIISIVSGVEF